jgi:hypothetical protein
MEGGRVRLKRTNYGYQLSNGWKESKINSMVGNGNEEVQKVGQVLFRNRPKIEDYIITFDPMDFSVIIMKVRI